MSIEDLICSFTIKSSPLALSFYKFLTQETISTLVISPFISLFRLFIRLLSISGRLISSSLFVSGALLIFLKNSKSESIEIFGCFLLVPCRKIFQYFLLLFDLRFCIFLDISFLCIVMLASIFFLYSFSAFFISSLVSIDGSILQRLFNFLCCLRAIVQSVLNQGLSTLRALLVIL